MRERRRYVRVNYESPVQVKSLDNASTPAFRGALAMDVSENGLRFVTDRFVSVHSRMMVEMNFPPSYKPVKVIAKPAWVRELPGSERYEIGNLFLEIAEHDKEIIRDFVEHSTGASFS